MSFWGRALTWWQHYQRKLCDQYSLFLELGPHAHCAFILRSHLIFALRVHPCRNRQQLSRLRSHHILIITTAHILALYWILVRDFSTHHLDIIIAFIPSYLLCYILFSYLMFTARNVHMYTSPISLFTLQYIYLRRHAERIKVGPATYSKTKCR